MTNNSKADRTERLPTGVPGLDVVLQGGVFPGGIYIVQGAPGAGKTILGNQICFGQSRAGHKALYVTLLAESHSRMLSHMRGMTFFDEKAIPDNVSYFGAFKILEEEGLKGLLDVVRREVRARSATVVVLDGLISVLGKLSSDLELKKFVHELQTQAVFSGCTMFLLTSAFDKNQAFPPEHTMVDGLIEMQTRMHGRRAERQLQVHKLRGGGFVSGMHSLRITDDGVVVYPRIEAVLAVPSVAEREDTKHISTGIEGLDAMMGGGPDQHSSTLVLGPAGCGKTTTGLHFLGACRDGERALLFGFNENPAATRIKAKAMGLPLARMLEQDRVELVWHPTTEAVLDEVCADLFERVRRRKVKRVFLDGLDGFEKLTDENARIGGVLAAVCNELRALGVAVMATIETDYTGIIPGQPLAGMSLTGLSPLADNIIVMRLAGMGTQVYRLITALKSRDSEIDMRMRSFAIGEHGIVIESDFASAEKILSQLSQSAAPPLNPRASRSGD